MKSYGPICMRGKNELGIKSLIVIGTVKVYCDFTLHVICDCTVKNTVKTTEILRGVFGGLYMQNLR